MDCKKYKFDETKIDEIYKTTNSKSCAYYANGTPKPGQCRTIINEYKWETALDTNSTWRIGDGTASFYNYIYTLIVGFSENDTFRSNQIREGIISREEALSFVYDENKPRYNSIKWYLEIIGLNYLETISIINKIERKY